MARAQKNENTEVVESTESADSGTPEMKRTTYPLHVSITGSKDGQEVLIYTAEKRSYGEGPIVALGNGIKKETEFNVQAKLDVASITPFGATFNLPDGYKSYVGLIWSDAQCPKCGAPRDAKNSWCGACNGNVEVDLSSQLSDMIAGLKK